MPRNRANAVAVRLFGTELLTVRIDLMGEAAIVKTSSSLHCRARDVGTVVRRNQKVSFGFFLAFSKDFPITTA